MESLSVSSCRRSACFLIVIFVLLLAPGIGFLFPSIGHILLSDACAQNTNGYIEDPAINTIPPAIAPTDDVNLSTGAAALKIPIEVPPGRGGIAPKLALTYNSFQGNGWIGMGWNLDMGSIQRSTKHGLNYGNNGSLAFTASVNGSSSELVLRSDWGGGYYGERIEGALSKYYNSNPVSSGWVVTTKDGTRYFYGSNTYSRQDNANGIFKWCLDRVEDVHGNYMTITYDISHKATTGEIYLSRIDYTYNTNNTVGATSYVTFTLEDRTDAPIMFTPNVKVQTAKRLKTIEVRGYGNGSLVRRYNLTYGMSAGSSRSLLKTITTIGNDGSTALPAINLTWDEQQQSFDQGTQTYLDRFYDPQQPRMYFGDFNGDGRTDIIYCTDIPTGTSYNYWRTHLSNANGDFTYGNDNYFDRMANPQQPNVYTGDFNGDGKTDIIYRTGIPTSTPYFYWRIQRSNTNGNGGFTYMGDYYFENMASPQEPKLFTGDFNGDGKTDIIYYSNVGSGYWMVNLANSNNFSSYLINLQNMQSPEQPYIHFADFNGDGKTDIIYRMANGYWRVMLSSGNGAFTTAADDLMEDMANPTQPILNFGDFNGDGKTDIIYYTTSGWYRTKFSNGDGSFTTMDNNRMDNISHPENPYWHLGDFDGDGRMDVFYYVGDYMGLGRWRLKLSNGRGSFGDAPAAIVYVPYTYSVETPYWHWGDFDGDGRSDIFYRVSVNNNWMVKHSNAGSDLLMSLSNGIGGSTAITYTTTPPNSNIPFKLKVVSSITKTDGRGQSLTTNYTYGGGHYDFTEREIIGFSPVTVYRMITGGWATKTDTYFHQDYPRKGLIQSQVTTSNESHSQSITNTWTSVSLSGGAIWPRLDRVFTKVTDAGYNPYYFNMSYLYDPTYLAVTQEKKFQSDASGNAIANTLVLITNTTYTNLTGPWILSLPQTVQITDGSGNIAAAKWMDYYASNNPATGAAIGKLQTEVACRSDDPASGCGDRYATQHAVTTHQYTAEGNLSQTTDPRGYSTTYTYDNTKTYVRDTTNHLGHATTTEYYAGIGKIKRRVPPHLQGTAYEFVYAYDVFGRPSLETRPDLGSTTYSYNDSGNASSQYTRKTEHVTGASPRCT